MASRLGRNPFIKHSKPQDILRSTRYLGQKKLSSKINFQAGNAHIQNKSYFFDRQRTFCKVTCYHSSSYAKAKSRYYLMSIYPLIFLTYVSSSNEIKDTSYKEEDNSKQPIFAEEMTMFLEAVVHNDLSIVKDSIKNGSYVNQMNNKKQTALHLSNSLDMISYLLSQNANINAQDESMNTPLILACRNNETEKAKLLIANGADVRIKDNKGFTALYYAQKNKNEALVTLLLIKVPNIEELSDEYLLEKGRKTIMMLEKYLEKK